MVNLGMTRWRRLFGWRLPPCDRWPACTVRTDCDDDDGSAARRLAAYYPLDVLRRAYEEARLREDR